MKIGFIGMGIMGSRMASNLQQQSHELIIFNRTEDNVSHLVANGALSDTVGEFIKLPIFRCSR